MDGMNVMSLNISVAESFVADTKNETKTLKKLWLILDAELLNLLIVIGQITICYHDVPLMDLETVGGYAPPAQ
jgi:hypothetical protein